MSIYGSLPSPYISIVTEAYVGKSPILLQIQDLFGQIRKKYNRFSDINHSPELLQINRLFEKQFGMEVFALHIDPSDEVNAFTNVIALTFDVGKKIKELVKYDKSRGFYFTPNNNLCILCTMYYGMLKQSYLTDAELVACCLHEIGHNFADAIDNDIRIDNQKLIEMLVSYYTYEAIINQRPNFSNAKRLENSKKDQSKKASFFRGLLSGISGIVADKINYVASTIKYLIFGGTYEGAIRIRKIYGVDVEAKKSLDRRNEVIADKFAGIYGYGPEQASGLIKMDNAYNNPDKLRFKIPIIGPLLKASYKDFMRKIGSYDSHANTIQRLNEEVKLLEYEIANSDLDPKLLKAAKAQLKQLIEIRDKITKAAPTASEQEKLDAEYNAYINSTEPNMVDDELEEIINKEFNSIK